ncbi:DNA adenine methylase [Brevundimonas nasdae]|jgi:adenine-specific DNA-methyltransferase|uniref:DNA adenine methylase n=1 Tax=Brevundimonas nasdae TaxID=172043 RepID=UPI003F68BE3D
MTFRYIGSKARVVEAIARQIGAPRGSCRFVDLFCGTGAVAQAAARMGWDVHLNDTLHSAVTMAAGRLITPSSARFDRLGGYRSAIETLNALPAIAGFLHREYSPASVDRIGFERRYFTEQNAGRIDAIRAEIRAWRALDRIDESEELLLIADLLSAVNRAANIAGTYGCFLSKWQAQAHEPMALRARALFDGEGAVTTSVGEARDCQVGPDDLAYIDPPYTKRQYAAYYHILETVTLGDTPVVEGVSGLRPWRSKASDFCYRNRALGAFTELVERLDARRLLFSYSDDAHIEIEILTKALRSYGAVIPVQIQDIGRYRPNRAASRAAASVSEYLIQLDRKQMKAAA